MAASVWSHEGGYAEITSFRRNPSLYLNTRKIDEETFAHNILQALCQDGVPTSIKIHLLNCLQEYASVILPSTTSAEEVVASLLDIFQQTAAKDGPSIFRGQTLVSITSIALQFDFNELRVDLFAKVVETLLEVACHTGTPSDGHLRTIACSCLQELETCLPCMLQNKLEYVYQLAQMERGLAAQGYFLLLVTILRHALGLLRLQDPAEVTPNAVGTLLSDRTEPLKPYILPKVTSDCRLLHRIDEADPLTGIDVTEMRRLVGFVVDYSPLLTPTAQVHVLLNLAQTVKDIPEISPSMFKWVIMRNTRSFDMGFISLLLSMHEGFGASLVDLTDTSVLFRSIVTGLAHPGVTSTQRLILMEWLTELTQVEEDPGWPGFLGHSLLTRIFPRTFDGCELQVKKLQLLSRLLRSYLPDDEVEEVLCSCLQLLQASVESGLGGRYATILFKSLYAFYKHLPNRHLVCSIKWILIRLGQNHSRLALRVLNFVEAAQKLQPNSELGREVLLSLLTSITMVTQSSSNLTQIQHHLVVLNRIASETSINPQEIVSYMQKLVRMEAICCQGDWETGSRILSVCRSLMAHHNVSDIFVGLGHVLHHLSVQHRDVDIRDRAVFYYTLLCSLAPHKLTSLLALTTTSSHDTQGLAVMVSRNSNLSGLRPVTRLQKPLLRLFRIKEDKPSESTLTDTVIIDTLEKYWEYLDDNDELTRLAVDVYLHFDKDSTEDIDEIFALELHFESSPFYKPIADVQVPWTSRAESSLPGTNCCRFHIQLEPSSSTPIQLSPEAVFTTRDGQTWRTPVAGVDITLEDLWRPLPVPTDTIGTLYTLLWASMTKHTDSSGGPLESVLSLNIKDNDLNDLLGGRWRPLVVETDNILSSISSTYTPTTLMTSDDLTSKDVTSERRVRHLGMFLPPKHHVLLEVVPSSERTVIYIATDHGQVLPLLTEYLRGFEAHEE